VNERVKSSFQHKELFFKPYDANQLREIMFNREDAFQDGVLSEDVIPLSRPSPRRNTAMLGRRSTFFATPARSPTRPEQSK